MVVAVLVVAVSVVMRVVMVVTGNETRPEATFRLCWFAGRHNAGDSR